MSAPDPAERERSLAMLNAEAYYDKFLLQKRVYANYAKTGKLVSLGPTLGCGKENGIPQWLQDRLDDYQCHAPIKKKKTTKKHS